MRQSSFVMVPSEWYENNPMTIVEGYSNGKPAIGSDVGGIPEIVIPNKTGFIHKMGDAQGLSRQIAKAEQLDKNDYISMSVNARKFAEEHFSDDQYYGKLLGIYGDVLRDRN